MTFVDKRGCPFETKSYESGDYACLVEMYVSYTPKGAFQGLPPKKEEDIVTWIDMLLRDGENLLAWQEGKVVGHAAILPDRDGENAEYLIFVRKGNRGLGVGNSLTTTAIEKAKGLGIARVWLTVDAYNFPAMKLYKKVGFDYCEECEYSSERLMILNM